MSVDHTQLLINNTKKLFRRGATVHLKKVIAKSHPADLSGVFKVLTPNDQKSFFDLLESIEKKAALFRELEIEMVQRLIEDLSNEEVVEILEHMPKDDVADLLGKISSVRSNALLDLMTKESSEVDPAIATGPFVTTFTDILSVFFYFKIATLLLHL